MKKIIVFAIIMVMMIYLAGCVGMRGQRKIDSAGREIILSTTTSTENSGLLAYILPELEKDTGLRVKVVAVGTGQALEMGKKGDADVLLVHAKDSEIKFVQEGFGVERIEVMYNDFVLVGPKDDPAKLSQNFTKDIKGALNKIHQSQSIFISRGDDSGTHKMELALWKQVSLTPKDSWYLSIGQGMGKTLQMADEKNGYALADRATYLSMADKLDLKILVEGDKELFNQYGVIAVSDKKYPDINIAGANEFIKWVTSQKGQKMIGDFGKDKYGQSLFIPNAKK